MEGICYMAVHNHREVKQCAQGHIPTKWWSQNHLTLKASILNHQVTLLLRQHGSRKMPAGPPFSWIYGVDGYARAAIILRGANPHTFYCVTLLCTVSISNIISRSKISAPIQAIRSVFQSLRRKKKKTCNPPLKKIFWKVQTLFLLNISLSRT